MISHKYKCIFIHISKCAGTSIEYAFGVDIKNYKAEDNDFLFGWDKTNKLWLQHATPQQLIDHKYISQNQWNNYYKFIIYRNSWDRAYSDYKWMINVKNVEDTFSNFLNKKGKYKDMLNDNSSSAYVGDHLYLQKDYFFLNGNKINYNRSINFSNLNLGLENVTKDLSLDVDFFKKKLNISQNNNLVHYSHFYNLKKKKLVFEKYKEDIDFFKFKFDEKKNTFKKIIANLK